MLDATMSQLGPIKYDTRFFPTLVGAFVTGLVLLFYSNLTVLIQNRVVPAMVIYVLGTALIAWFQTMLGIRRKDILSSPQFMVICILHLFWFAGLVLFSLWPLFCGS